MAYIGRQNLGGAYRQLDDISSGFDGSDTTHTMQVNSQNVTVGDVNQIILSLGGVIQKPGTDFTVSGSVLTFTTAPAANTSFFAILLGSDNGGTVTPTDGSVTTGKIVDDAVTAAKVASSGAFAIGAAGTSSSLAGIPFYNADNSIYTHDVSGTDSTAEKNVAIGITAMDAITTGDQNVAIGHAAASAITDDAQNVAIGASAMETSVSTQCTAVGFEALKVGQYGGHTAIGFEALKSNTTGANNTAVGSEAMENNTLGNNNVAVGLEALTANTEGDQNVAVGSRALDACDTEDNNTAIGMGSLGGSIAGGEYNVGVGNFTLDAVTSGDANVAVGYAAASELTTGNYNVSIGYEAQHNGVTSGEHNICLGYRSGYDLTSGGNNVFAGLQAGAESTTGSNNVGLGAYAAYNIVGDGNYNTLVGYAAGFEITTGDNNSCLGKDSGRTGSPGGSLVTTNNNICLGDNNVNALHCQASLTVASDERDKTDFTALDVGLDFVNDLKPYTYKWDKRIKYVADADRDTVDLDTVTHDGTHKEDWLDIGFKAQEIEVLEKAAGYKITDKTNLVTSLSNDGKQYGLRYEKFVPILVKAIQELSAKVKALEEA